MKNQTILFVNKIPAKATMQTDDYDSYDEEMELGENPKSVSFSPQDEVVEIAPRSPKRLIVKPRIGKSTGRITVKARLGKLIFHFFIKSMINLIIFFLKD